MSLSKIKSELECIHCFHLFKTISNLNNHQKTAQYCLEIQGKLEELKFICDFCLKKFSQKIHLQKHLEICSNKKISQTTTEHIQKLKSKLIFYKVQNKELREQLENQEEKYELKIKELQDKLENIAIKAVQKPTYSNTTTTNKTVINQKIDNLLNITDEHMKDSAQYLTIDHILKGVEGYVDFALEHTLKDRLICTDFARKITKYKNEDNQVIKDPEMKTLIKKFFQAISEKNIELIQLYRDEITRKLEIEEDNIKTSLLLNNGVKIEETRANTIKATKGIKTEFSDNFIKEICVKTSV